MPQCVVIADDLTGGNAAGVLLRKTGYRTFTLLDGEAENIDAFDCVIAPVDSRSLPPAEAAARVAAAANALRSPTVRLYAKRIDTTLRGNLGSETDALLDTLGAGHTALVVPCFPSSGRILVHGQLLVHGIPLHRTEAATDPKNPVDTADCAALFARQTKYPVASIHAEEIKQGNARLTEKIRNFATSGIRHIIFDAATQEDIDAIADAALRSGILFIAVDSGVFTAALAKRMLRRMSVPQPKILAAIGSVNPVTLRQVDHFLANEKTFNVSIRVQEFLKTEDRREAEIVRVVNIVLAAPADADTRSIIGEGIRPECRIAIQSPEQSELINGGIAEITARIAQNDESFQAFYTSGGDITVAVCRRLGANGLELLDEVLPLAAYGKIAGGKYGGLHMITKGGMVGEPAALSTCIQYLRKKLQESHNE